MFWSSGSASQDRNRQVGLSVLKDLFECPRIRYCVMYGDWIPVVVKERKMGGEKFGFNGK